MDNANMPPGSDNSNDSDDLIAELARLMAAEAKGEPEQNAQSDSPEPPLSAGSGPAPEPVSASEPLPADDEPRVDPIPRLPPEAPVEPAPEATRSVPEFVRPQSHDETPSIQVSETPQSPSSSPLDAAIAARSAASEPVRETSQQAPVPSAPEPKAAKVFQDPIAPSLRNQQQQDPSGLGDQFSDDKESPSSSLAPEPAAPRFTPPTEPQTSQSPASEPEDPIGALISAQLETIGSEEFAEPPMAQTPKPAPASAKDDSFGVAPVFGVGGPRADAENVQAKRDPLDDIESLIGSALRTEQRAEPQSQATAVSQPEKTTPARSNDELAGAASAAEAAILAATQSMQAQSGSGPAAVSVAEPSVAQSAQAGFADPTDTRPGTRPASTTRSGGWRRIAGPLVAAALLVAVGLGLYWMLGTGGNPEGDAPVLSADTSPVKEAGETAPTETGGAGSVVLSESGNQTETIERLISRDETTDVAGNEVSRVITPSESEDLGLANRKVRTVTVRPDGTIVSGDDAVAGGQQLPVERPNVPQLSAADTPSAVAANDTPIAPQVTQTLTTTSAPSGPTPPIPLPRPTNRASAPTRFAAPPATTPVSNSNSNAVNLIANTANQAVTTTQSVTTSVPVVSSASAPAYVQLSSQRTRDAASRSLNAVQSQFAPQLSGGTLEIQEVNLGERGVFYRVRLPAQSIETANSVCANIKSAGGDCFVRTD